MNVLTSIFPSLKRRGGCAVKKISRSHLCPRRRARSASAIARSRKCGQFGEIFRPEGFAGLAASFDGCALSGLRGLRPPSAPSKEASRYLLDVASTPPFQGDLCITAVLLDGAQKVDIRTNSDLGSVPSFGGKLISHRFRHTSPSAAPRFQHQRPLDIHCHDGQVDLYGCSD